SSLPSLYERRNDEQAQREARPSPPPPPDPARKHHAMIAGGHLHGGEEGVDDHGLGLVAVDGDAQLGGELLRGREKRTFGGIDFDHLLIFSVATEMDRRRPRRLAGRRPAARRRDACEPAAGTAA